MWNPSSLRRVTALSCGLLGLALLLTQAHAQERILNFDVSIQVQRNAQVIITETLRVRAHGQAIRRGIYREFPLSYRTTAGILHEVDFEVLDIMRNGQPEPWFSERRDNGIRIYIGDGQVMLPPGIHEYQIQYATNRQVGYFDEYDELYWNVTGHGWRFPIDSVTARLVLPLPVEWKSLQIDYFTGAEGAREKNARYDMIDGRTVGFFSGSAFAPGEGLTIAVGWPKGLVYEPSSGDRMLWFIRANTAVMMLMLGLLTPLLWYCWAWNAHGRDPAKGTIIPRFSPPKDLSPAACRYILDMRFGSRAMSAAVINLGIKGHLAIEELEKKFVLYRKHGKDTEEPTPGEHALLSELLPEKESWIELDQKNYADFQRARAELSAALKAEYQGRLFKLNTIYMIPAILLGLLFGLAAIALGPHLAALIIFLVLSLVMHIFFLFLLRAPTRLGRKIMDEIEGFRMYLKTAERDRLNRMQSPRLTPQVFEQFLPYAFALGVQNQWCERFAQEFPREARQGAPFRRNWYTGQYGGLTALQHIGNNLGSGLESAISSASSPPGSSSGSAGGGFSGGGGGGGGGGGW